MKPLGAGRELVRGQAVAQGRLSPSEERSRLSSVLRMPRSLAKSRYRRNSRARKSRAGPLSATLLLRWRPLLRAMEHPDDFNFGRDPIDEEVRRSRHGKFARGRRSARASSLRRLNEDFSRRLNSIDHCIRRPRAIATDIVSDQIEVPAGRDGPAQLHSGCVMAAMRRRRSLNTSSWSMSSPRSAEARPSCTAARNQRS